MLAIAHDFADPMVLKAPDGYYYAYATQRHTPVGWTNIQVARSRDLQRWEDLGDALPTKPAWADKTQDFWAPHVVADGKRFIMYFSSDTNAKSGLGLGVATATSPAGPFKPEPQPLVTGPGFENIDPFAFDDPKTGKHWLYWGSGFQPIRMQELAADRLRFAPDSKPSYVLWPSRDPYEALIEGAYVTEHAGQYYLWYSGDNCCSDPAHYAVMVARAPRPEGPYIKFNYASGHHDSVVLRANARWDGPGHNGFVTDDQGQDWLVYHAVDRKQRTEPGMRDLRRVLMLDRVSWQDGWPVVEGPSP